METLVESLATGSRRPLIPTFSPEGEKEYAQ